MRSILTAIFLCIAVPVLAQAPKGDLYGPAPNKVQTERFHFNRQPAQPQIVIGERKQPTWTGVFEDVRTLVIRDPVEFSLAVTGGLAVLLGFFILSKYLERRPDRAPNAPQAPPQREEPRMAPRPAPPPLRAPEPDKADIRARIKASMFAEQSPQDASPEHTRHTEPEPSIAPKRGRGTLISSNTYEF